MVDDEVAFSDSVHYVNQSAWINSGRPSPPHSSIPHRTVLIPHMEWDCDGNHFKSQRPRKLPTIKVSVDLLRGAHASFHKQIPPNAKSCSLTAVADTGAQTCASGPGILQSLGLTVSDLIPTSHRIKGVTQSALNIQGVLLARLSCGNRHSNQVVYICDNASDFYLSGSALRDLGCLPTSFPSSSNHFVLSSSSMAQETTCPCLKRTKPPSRPSAIPYPPTENNIKKLETWIVGIPRIKCIQYLRAPTPPTNDR